MREYGFSLTRILPYKDKIVDFVLMRENKGQWKPIFSHILFYRYSTVVSSENIALAKKYSCFEEVTFLKKSRCSEKVDCSRTPTILLYVTATGIELT